MQKSVTQAPPPGYVRRFIDAVREVIRYVLFGLVVGSVLVWLSTWAKEVLGLIFVPRIAELGAKLLEHVGMGFIVAAIAVLFYEWRAHLKAVERVSSELTALREAVAAQALDGALRVYVDTGDGEHDREVIAAITGILENLKKLQDRGDWTQKGFQRFITAMIRNVSMNAETLATLSGPHRTASARAASYNVVVHTPVQLVDIILAEQVGRLPNGGKYRVVTNPLDWQEGQFIELRKVSALAVAKGILVRRILVLTDSGPNAYAGPHSEIARILDMYAGDSEIARLLDVEPHLGDARPPTSGIGYSFKVLDEYERKHIGKLKDDAGGNLVINHFAVIECPGKDYCLEVSANDPALFDFQLKGVRPNSARIGWFDLVWEKLPELDSAKIQEILARWKAANPSTSVLEQHGGPVKSGAEGGEEH
jgi:hypothetical protein